MRINIQDIGSWKTTKKKKKRKEKQLNKTSQNRSKILMFSYFHKKAHKTGMSLHSWKKFYSDFCIWNINNFNKGEFFYLIKTFMGLWMVLVDSILTLGHREM